MTNYQGKPERLLEECRERIDASVELDRRLDVLAVTQVLARLRFKSPRLFEILGGRKVIHDSPIIREFVEEERSRTLREAIVRILEARFGYLPADARKTLESIADKRELDDLILAASQCTDLAAFENQLKNGVPN